MRISHDQLLRHSKQVQAPRIHIHFLLHLLLHGIATDVVVLY
uniref:NADH kinase 1 n=1 Tax=Rhizophora mucronata TaxID=61149 RepID=A0A2P2L4U8_RHIMU